MNPILTSDGAELHGHHWPVAKPEAIITLVHGFGEHGGRYEHMAAHLNANEIAVVSADLRGHGQTVGPRGVIRNYDMFRADLSALLERTRELYPNVPHVLFGHSMGGGIVLDYGLDPAADICAIIASAPLIELAEPPPAAVKVIAKFIGNILPKAAMSQPIDGTKISTLPEEQLRYESDPLCHGRLGFRTARAMIETGEAIADQVDSWKTPLLLYHAPQDELTSYEASKAFAARAQNVDFHTLENVAHEMHNDVTRERVYALLTGFILSHAKDTAI